jgi:hypothetical protein
MDSTELIIDVTGMISELIRCTPIYSEMLGPNSPQLQVVANHRPHSFPHFRDHPIQKDLGKPT